MSIQTSDRRALPAPLLDDAAGHVAPLGRPSSPPATPEQQRPADCAAATGRLRFRLGVIAAVACVIVIGSAAMLAFTAVDAPAPPARVSDKALGASIVQTSGTVAQLLEHAAARHAAARRVEQRKLVAARRARAQRRSAQLRSAQRRRAARQEAGRRRRAATRRPATRRPATRRAAARRAVASRPRRVAPPRPPMAPVRPVPRHPAPEFPF